MKKVRDDIYQVMHGFKPLKRGERRKGQSEWYYLDPRYKDDDAQKEIDVLDGEAPNPRLGRILSDDMQKNPDDYYIWRTKKMTECAVNTPSAKVRYLTGTFCRMARG